MSGYFGEAKSSTFLKGGWLPTGDIMQKDNNGFIEIIDRKKEIYKNIKGETVAPQKIENFFRDIDSVKQVFLAGDHRSYNTVLLVPNYENDVTNLNKMNDAQIQEYFSSVIVTVNKFLSPFERIIDFRIIDRSFSDEYGELTPKNTYRRRIIEKNFKDIIEARNISLELELNNDVEINVNTALADILIINLIKNAIRHNFDDGKLNILLGHNYLEISNTGPKFDIPADQLFNRFVRAHSTSDSLGLGLSMVKKISELYNFDIQYIFEEDLHKLIVTF